MKRTAKEKLIDRYQRRGGLQRDDTGRGYHSGAYHRYFEGYSEFETVDERGKVRIKRVYTGTWYTPDFPRGRLARQKLLYILLWLLAVGLFIFSATRITGAHSVWYGALAQVIVAGCLCWTAVGLFNYLTVPFRRTVGDWRSSSGTLKKAGMACAFAFGLAAALDALYLLFTIDAFWIQLLCIALYLCGTVLMLLLNRLEANAVYIETPSENTAPPGAAEIE